MSGIEAVGILLGAFPLLISAFEHYRDVAKAAGLLVNWEAEYLKSLNEVKDEEILFRQSMVLLLWPLVDGEIVESDQLDALMQSPGGAGWHDGDVEQALKSRLGEVMERYVGLMEELQSSVFKLLQALGFDRPKFQQKLSMQRASRPFSSLMSCANSHLLRRLAQVRFAIGKPARDEALAEIRAKNEKLEKLLRGCDKVAKLQETQTVSASRKVSRSLLHYWRHAGIIYALFQSSWVCTCKDKHCAHLRLHHPPTNANELNMLIFWAPEPLLSSNNALWQPQDLQISWIQGTALQDVLYQATSATIASSVLDGTVASRSQNASRRAEKRVKFDLRVGKPAVREAENAAKSSIAPASGIAGPLQNSAVSSPVSCDGLINDICKAIATIGIAPQQLGALTDPVEGRRYIVRSRPDDRVAPANTSLHNILQQQEGKPLKRRSDRFQIALAIASAHLQLRSTPWARRQWEAKDILFPQEPQRSGRGKFEPYISADFNDNLSTKAKQPKQTDRSFACLGIMLLELCFGVLLEEHEFWSKPGMEQNKSDPAFRTMVAAKWAQDDVEGEAGPKYAAAVNWCLRESPMTLDGDQWRKDLADQVVMPLQHCWDCIKPNTAP